MRHRHTPQANQFNTFPLWYLDPIIFSLFLAVILIRVHLIVFQGSTTSSHNVFQTWLHKIFKLKEKKWVTNTPIVLNLFFNFLLFYFALKLIIRYHNSQTRQQSQVREILLFLFIFLLNKLMIINEQLVSVFFLLLLLLNISIHRSNTLPFIISAVVVVVD